MSQPSSRYCRVRVRGFDEVYTALGSAISSRKVYREALEEGSGTMHGECNLLSPVCSPLHRDHLLLSAPQASAHDGHEQPVVLRTIHSVGIATTVSGPRVPYHAAMKSDS